MRTNYKMAVLLSLTIFSEAVGPYTTQAAQAGQQVALPKQSEPAGKTVADVKTRLLATRPRVGMELWTYTRQLTADLPGTLTEIRNLGFTNIETASFYGRPASEFRKLLNIAGLTCKSIIVDYDKLRDHLDTVIADAKTMGADYVVTAGFPHDNPLTAEEVHRATVDFNDWGAKLKRQGLQFGYHPHGFEFVSSGEGNLFDLMLAETSAAFVTYELDTYHFTQGGADPVKYLKRHPSRFSLVHLADMAKGTPTGAAVYASDDTSVALGTGAVEWPAVFAAAKQARVKLYYLEDGSSAAPTEVPQSIKFLKSSKMWSF